MSELFPIPQVAQLQINDPVLPDPNLMSYYMLEQDRKIYIDCDIGQEVLAIQQMIFRWNMEDKNVPVEERKPITVYIMSYGGEMDYMWSLVDTIMLSVTPVTTVNLGVASSAAFVIFLAGQKRLMMPNAACTIHEGSASMSGDAVKVFDATDTYRKQIQRMKNFVIGRTNITSRMLNKKHANDWTVNAEESLKYGVCHQIVNSLADIL